MKTYRDKIFLLIFLIILLFIGSIPASVMGSGPPGGGTPGGGSSGPPGGGPPGGPPPMPVTPFVETTNQVEENHILAVAGRSGTPQPYLGVQVFPKNDGEWSFSGEPSNRYNPMSVFTPFTSAAPRVDLNVVNTVDNASYIAGAMRFEAEIDATDRYDFEGAEFYARHTDQDLLEGIHMLGRLQTANTERFHKADFKLGGIEGSSPTPEVEQIRWLRGQHEYEYQPVWWEFRDDINSRRQRTGIYPNLPYRETVKSRPGHYQVNYNIRSAGSEALVDAFTSESSASYKPFVPGVYDFSAVVHLANGDAFEFEKQFPVHGLVVAVEDEKNERIAQVPMKVTGCSYFPPSSNENTDEEGRLKIIMQPAQTCRIYSGNEQFLIPDDEEREVPVLGFGADVIRDPVELPARRILHGKVETAGGVPFQLYQIEATPIGADIAKRARIIANNNLKLKDGSDENGEYRLELPYGKYELKAYRGQSKHYIRPAGSNTPAQKTAGSAVEFPVKGYNEIISSGIPEKTVDWEIIPAESKIRAIVKKINSDGEVVYAQRENVRIKGQTPAGQIIESGNTGVFKAIASFEDLPRGTYRVSVTVTKNVLDGIPQTYQEVITLGDYEEKTVNLGP